MRVVVVHDWLYIAGGAERVLKEILTCFPGADLFTLFDVLTPEQRGRIGYETSHTSFLQRIPGISKIHRSLLPLMPFAIEQFDLSGYDLIISSSCAVAKGVITGPDQLHISYVHSPMRYAWDLQHRYLRESTGKFGLKRLAARLMLHSIRTWDSCSGLRPDAIVANSAYVGRRIKKAFGRAVHVIHPPVDVAVKSTPRQKSNYFLAAGRLVSYKNTRAIVEAFRLLPDRTLVVAGTGPEEKLLQSIAGPNVTFTGFVSDDEMRCLMGSGKALIFAAEEDFGIVPVEAQAEGTPVLALGRGGARETVIGEGRNRTGMFFDDPSPDEIAACVGAFISESSAFSPEACQLNAKAFSAERFRRQFKGFVLSELKRMNFHTGTFRPAVASLLLAPAPEVTV
jgi:glycosyltransferase involved in cell wall biosynthesis